MNKKIFTAVLAGTMLLSASANAETDIKIKINGEELVCEPLAVVQNDRVLVPMRAIFEKLDAQVNWDEDTKTITAAKSEFIMLMQVGNDKMFRNNEQIELDAAPIIVDERAMVPVRAVAESFKIQVDWDAEAREVNINF